MSFIALDLGTSFIKGAVLDLDHLQLDHIRRLPFPGPLPGLPPLFYEVDPGAVVTTVRTLIGELLAETTNCEGVVLCTQMHGLVLCTDVGEPLSNIITWQDQRVLMPYPKGGGTYFDRLLAQISLLDRQRLGNELQSSRPLCYLHWLAENDQLPLTPAIPVGLADFVIANLCQTPPAIELTGAGAHCLLNLETLDWHYPVIAQLGLANLLWPPIRAFGEVVGMLPIAGKTLPCYTPVGDHQCALVGAFLGADELSLNISTGSQASMVTPALALGDYQTRPFFDSRFLNTITGIPAGRALNHLVDLLTELAHSQGIDLPDPWSYIIEATSAVAESDLEVNLAFFDSIGGKHGHITNIREDNLSVGHLFRAAFQNMTENYFTSALCLAPQKTWQNLVFSGGLAQKIAVLREMILHKFQAPHRLCASAEDTLLGLLALALVASGRIRSVEEAINELLVRYREPSAA